MILSDYIGLNIENLALLALTLCHDKVIWPIHPKSFLPHHKLSFDV